MAKGKYRYWLTDEGLTLLAGWARDGLTDEQIARNMGIGYSTLQSWKIKYQDIQDTLKKGKEIVDYEVENALLKTALSGNTTAQIFWLRNRRPDRWRNADRPETPQERMEDDPLSKSIEEAAANGLFSEADESAAVPEK